MKNVTHVVVMKPRRRSPAAPDVGDVGSQKMS